MLARKVITRSGRRFRGRYPSVKCSRMVAFESLLELSVIQLLEFSSAVENYREQPELVFYSDGDVMKKYYPDFEVVLTSGIRIHIEVKPSAMLAAPKLSGTYQQIARHYQGFRPERFRIVTEQEARARTRSAAAVPGAWPFLLRFAQNTGRKSSGFLRRRGL